MPRLAMPLDGLDALVAVHNIVGPAGVLNVAAAHLVEQVGAHYAPRGIDHLPYDPNLRCYVLTPQPDEMRSQAVYREQLAGIPFIPIASLDEIAAQGVRSALHLPYIRLIDDVFPDSIEWRRYGLPPAITARLKDKNYMHPWMLSRGFAASIPNFISCTVDDIPQRGRRMLQQITAMLDEFGMRGRYPAGLVIRGAFSDGNYGMASLTEAIHDMQINDVFVRRGEWILKPDGQTDLAEIFEGMEAALNRVVKHLHTQNDTHLDDRVLLTRLLDVNVSPGLCAVVAGGEVYDFPFNGQYMEPGHTACTGTWTFQAAVGKERARVISDGYLAQVHHMLRTILDYFFRGMQMSDLYAMLNLDLMMVGDLERELFERASALRALYYLDDFGFSEEEYRPRICDPAVVLFAEVNPRDTNWTIAMKAVLQALRLPCTVENLQMIGAGNEIQVLARDHWKLPPGLSVEDARDLLLDFHRQISENGEGFIMRMPDSPAGVILYTHNPDSNRLHALSNEAYAFLAKHV